MRVRTPRQVTRAFERRFQMARHRGRAVFCPLCGHRFACFKADGDRPNALCWRCGSHERHRAQWLLFEHRPELLGAVRSLLHFAPERALRRRLERQSHLRYVTADLSRPDVEMKLDITALDLPDGSFDAVICSHVLEHVDDDRAAMRELRRITAPGGWCLVMVPLDLARVRTYEDPTLTTSEDRRRAFGRPDHVRFYAPDIRLRLGEAGFSVDAIAPRAEFGDDLVELCRIPDADQIFLCRPFASTSP